MLETILAFTKCEIGAVTSFNKCLQLRILAKVPALFAFVCVLDKLHRSLTSRASLCFVGRLLCVKVNHVR